MARVLGVGGVFFKSKDPGALMNWYHDVLGLEVEGWGGVVFAPEPMAAQPGAGTVFSPFAADATYFAPSTKEFMINLAVDDLDGRLASCATHGVETSEDRALAAEADARLTGPRGPQPGCAASYFDSVRLNQLPESSRNSASIP